MYWKKLSSAAVGKLGSHKNSLTVTSVTSERSTIDLSCFCWSTWHSKLASPLKLNGQDREREQPQWNELESSGSEYMTLFCDCFVTVSRPHLCTNLQIFLYRQKADISLSDVCLAAQYVCVCSPALTSVKHTQRLVDREQRREMVTAM